MKTFLALYMGSPENAGRRRDLSEETIARGMAAWTAWMETNAGRIVEAGGPLGVTKKTDKTGVSDIRNEVAGFVVVNAETHDEAAALFLDHPHFAIFPGDRVEIMERLPIPGA
jgi:hypothetical protein